MRIAPAALSAVVAFAAAALYATTAGCGMYACPMVDCASDVRISIQDAQGKPLASFSGTVTINGRTSVVACGGADAGAVATDGGTDAGQGNDLGTDFYCTGEYLGLYSAPDLASVEVDLTSGSLKFKGPVALTRTENRIGPPHCNTSCSSARGTATLQ